MLELAIQLAGYFSDLRVQGFSRSEALTITVAYQTAMVTTALETPRADDGDGGAS